MAKSKAVGIDLGTTYSAMAWVDETGHSKVIPNGEGDLVTPSVVLFEDDATIVGKEAKKVAVLKADRVAICVKRDMGKPVYHKPIRGKHLPPEVIQSYILSKLKADANKVIGPDYRTIITVPAFFDEPRRKATYDAGEMAGLKVLDIVNEPTAAALAFGEDLGYLTKFGAPKQRMNVIVYDLGGGTFDVTLIDMQAGDLRTICTDGDVQLGGHDWDMRLVEYFSECFQKEHGGDPRTDPVSLQRMISDAEEAKHTLSARQQTKVRVQHQGKVTQVEITRQLFEQRTADLLERTRFTTRNLLATAGLEWKNIGRILLTGGSTRMPAVSKMIKELSGIEPDHTVNPDEAVARGASIYANYLLAAKGETGHAPTFDVTNVNAHSLGIEGIDPLTMRKVNTILIPRNSQLPAKKAEQCMTQGENQRTVVVQVLEGESRNPEECTPIGRTVIRNLPPNLPQGWPVNVVYEYGVNGRLTVRAKVEGTDREVTLDLERDHSMSQDRLAAWKKNIAKGGGMDAFDLLIQQELDTLSTHAPQGPSGLVFKPLPGAAGMPQMPQMPGGAPMPGMPQMPGQPGLPSMPQMPGQPQPAMGGMPSGNAGMAAKAAAAQMLGVPMPSAAPAGGPIPGMPRQPMSGQPMPGQPMPGQPMTGQPLPGGMPGQIPAMPSGAPMPGMPMSQMAMSGIHTPSGMQPPPGMHLPPSMPGQPAMPARPIGGPQPGPGPMPGMPGPMPGGPGGMPGMPRMPSGAPMPQGGPLPQGGPMPQGGAMPMAQVPGGMAGPGGRPPGMPGMGGPGGVATMSPPGAGTATASKPKAGKKKMASSGTDLLLYVMFITLGIMVGYYVLVWIAPGANFLRLNLPGLPAVKPAGPFEPGGAVAPEGTTSPSSTTAPTGTAARRMGIEGLVCYDGSRAVIDVSVE